MEKGLTSAGGQCCLIVVSFRISATTAQSAANHHARTHDGADAANQSSPVGIRVEDVCENTFHFLPVYIFPPGLSGFGIRI